MRKSKFGMVGVAMAALAGLTAPAPKLTHDVVTIESPKDKKDTPQKYVQEQKILRGNNRRKRLAGEHGKFLNQRQRRKRQRQTGIIK